MIAIVCSKDELECIPELEALFIRIAEFTGWLLVDECTDDDEEGFVFGLQEK